MLVVLSFITQDYFYILYICYRFSTANIYIHEFYILNNKNIYKNTYPSKLHLAATTNLVPKDLVHMQGGAQEGDLFVCLYVAARHQDFE